jgi:hypothetical protein
LFFKRLKEIGADGQWGIFSMAIPGRVGYQVMNMSNENHLLNQDIQYIPIGLCFDLFFSVFKLLSIINRNWSC